jgi:hypothetical protein
VEEDGDGGGCADGWRSVEGGGHGEAVGDVVGEICTVILSISPKFPKFQITKECGEASHQVQVSCQLHTGIDLLLLLHNHQLLI